MLKYVLYDSVNEENQNKISETIFWGEWDEEHVKEVDGNEIEKHLEKEKQLTENWASAIVPTPATQWSVTWRHSIGKYRE